MNNIKGIIFDVDDTLYSHKTGRIPELTKYTIKKLKEKGYILGVCTSRFPREFASLPDNCFEDFDLVIAGTGSVYLKNNEVFYVVMIEPEETKKYIEYLDRQDNIFYLWEPVAGDPHFSKEPIEKTRKHYESWSGICPTVQKYNGEELCNIIYYGATQEQTDHIIQMVGRSSLEIWGNCGHINPKGINKAYGINNFCKFYNLTLDELLCFGDGHNDVSMIESAKVGVAVGNGHELLKNHADYVCDTIDNSGIYTFCVEHGLIEPIDSKLFFFDIDGTTYQHSIHDNPESTKLALRQLKANGKKCFICTSRSYEEMSKLPKDYLRIMDGIICLGGAHMILDGKEYFTEINYDETLKASEHLDEHGCIYRYVDSQGNGYLNMHNQDIEGLFNYLYEMIPPVKTYDHEHLVHLLYYPNDTVDTEYLEKVFSSSHLIRLKRAHEVTPLGIHKGSAVEKVAQIYGCSLENCVTFGDANNDLTMIEMAQIGIAMGNATSTIKEKANYVCDSIEEDGLYKACKHFKWI